MVVGKYALQFANILQEDPRLLDFVHYVTTNSHGLFEQMVSAQGNSPTAPFVLCALVCESLRLPRGAYRDVPHPEGW